MPGMVPRGFGWPINATGSILARWAVLILAVIATDCRPASLRESRNREGESAERDADRSRRVGPVRLCERRPTFFSITLRRRWAGARSGLVSPYGSVSVAREFFRRHGESFGQNAERLLVDPLHSSLFDPGNRLGRKLRLEVFSPQATLLAQATQRSTK
jgi:hypothetical protein